MLFHTFLQCRPIQRDLLASSCCKIRTIVPNCKTLNKGTFRNTKITFVNAMTNISNEVFLNEVNSLCKVSSVVVRNVLTCRLGSGHSNRAK